MLGHINRQTGTLLHFNQRRFEPVRVAFEHVVALHPQLQELLPGKAAGRQQRFEVPEANSTVIIDTQESSRISSGALQEGAEDKIVELGMSKCRQGPVPK